MTEFERSRRMPADRETVFALASDPARLREWLPDRVEVRPRQDERVTARVGPPSAQRDVDALLDSEHDQMRVEWGSRGAGEYAGWLQVTDLAGEQSEVTVHLSFFDEGSDAPDFVAQTEEALGTSLDRLAELVGGGQQA